MPASIGCGSDHQLSMQDGLLLAELVSGRRRHRDHVEVMRPLPACGPVHLQGGMSLRSAPDSQATNFRVS